MKADHPINLRNTVKKIHGIGVGTQREAKLIAMIGNSNFFYIVDI